MSLSLREIERGIGCDLLCRPLISSVINATILRIFFESVYNREDENDSDNEEDNEKSCLNDPVVEKMIASTFFVITHLIQIVGFFETVFWTLIAIIFKIFKLPRVYAFEKLLLDVMVILWKPSVRYIHKTIRFQCRPGQKIPQLQVTRRGYGFFVITIIHSQQSLTRDTLATLHLFRYMNKPTITYWTEDTVVMVGTNDDIVRALCELGHQPSKIDLGWHKDVVESTNFRISVIFTQENLRQIESGISSVSKRAVLVELIADFSTKNLELVSKSMDQFAAVCEASERGKRQFQGKRVSIYGIGIVISVALIIFYEGLPGLLKPSADVLTLAVGAYTLWMTVGKSAALGETEEDALLAVYTRENILLAYHGLAHIEDNVINVGWVPEIFRDDHEIPPEEEAEDGSISVLEAAICLSIFQHYGHFIKWKGPRLVLDRMNIEQDEENGIGHIVSVERVKYLGLLEAHGEGTFLKRIG